MQTPMSNSFMKVLIANRLNSVKARYKYTGGLWPVIGLIIVIFECDKPIIVYTLAISRYMLSFVFHTFI